MIPLPTMYLFVVNILPQSSDSLSVWAHGASYQHFTNSLNLDWEVIERNLGVLLFFFLNSELHLEHQTVFSFLKQIHINLIQIWKNIWRVLKWSYFIQTSLVDNYSQHWKKFKFCFAFQTHINQFVFKSISNVLFSLDCTFNICVEIFFLAQNDCSVLV